METRLDHIFGEIEHLPVSDVVSSSTSRRIMTER